MKISGVSAAKVLGIAFLISLLIGCSTVNSWMSFSWDKESQQTAENQTLWQDFGKTINPVRQENAQYKKGRYFQQKKKYNLAIAEYRGVLQNNPRHIKALNAMGVTYDQLGDYFKAEMVFKAALELNDKREDLINNLGYCYLLQHKMPAAIEMFRQAVRMQGTNPIYRNNLGLAYAENEQYQLALQEFEHSKGRGKATPLSKPTTSCSSPNQPAKNIPPVAQAEIEISNGNGVNGMAHLVGNFLSKRSFSIKRLTNASRFTFATSTIFYCPGYAHDAHAVESQIPGDQQVDEVKELGRPNIKIRVLLGNDVINKRHFFKQSIITAEAGSCMGEGSLQIHRPMAR
ncbi:MAG: LytR C-terminal domain-containing protein [Desulfoplanes sp.]|nr:LytR C-terminal domain-containing protein [Desulfoplanes sp.]